MPISSARATRLGCRPWSIRYAAELAQRGKQGLHQSHVERQLIHQRQTTQVCPLFEPKQIPKTVCVCVSERKGQREEVAVLKGNATAVAYR